MEQALRPHHAEAEILFNSTKFETCLLQMGMKNLTMLAKFITGVGVIDLVAR
jgi:hypothetical protein